jgi:hypothetical protein
MVSHAGLSIDDHPLTVGSLAMMIGAFPTTILYKMVTGEAPFPEGKLPDFFTEAPRELDAASSKELLHFQMFIGMYRLTDLLFYPVLDVLSLSPKVQVPDGDSVTAPAPALYSRVVTTSRLLLHGVLGCPVWFGKDLHTPPAQAGPWISYVLKGVWSVADVYCAAASGSPMERYSVNGLPVKPTSLDLPFASTGIGVVSFLASWTPLLPPARPIWFDYLKCLLEAVPSFPWILGFSRALNDFFPGRDPWRRAFVGFDLLLGGASILCSGVQLVVLAAYQSDHPPTITAPTGPIDLGTVAVGAPFTSVDLEVSQGFPGYSWSMVTDVGQTGPPATAPGEGWTFLNASFDTAYPGRQVQLHSGAVSGEPGSYTFTVRVDDNFSGPGTDTHACQLTVV